MMLSVELIKDTFFLTLFLWCTCSSKHNAGAATSPRQTGLYYQVTFCPDTPTTLSCVDRGNRRLQIVDVAVGVPGAFGICGAAEVQTDTVPMNTSAGNTSAPPDCSRRELERLCRWCGGRESCTVPYEYIDFASVCNATRAHHAAITYTCQDLNNVDQYATKSSGETFSEELCPQQTTIHINDVIQGMLPVRPATRCKGCLYWPDCATSAPTDYQQLVRTKCNGRQTCGDLYAKVEANSSSCVVNYDIETVSYVTLNYTCVQNMTSDNIGLKAGVPATVLVLLSSVLLIGFVIWVRRSGRFSWPVKAQAAVISTSLDAAQASRGVSHCSSAGTQLDTRVPAEPQPPVATAAGEHDPQDETYEYVGVADLQGDYEALQGNLDNAAVGLYENVDSQEYAKLKVPKSAGRRKPTPDYANIF